MDQNHMAGDIIQVSGLKKSYRAGFFLKEVPALTGVSFSVRDNELYGFLGPNGAGKTTTIKILNSIVFPTSGEVRIFGDPPGEIKNRGRIGFLPEQPYFYDYLTGMEFLRFCGKLFGIEKERADEKGEELLHVVGLGNAKDLQLRKYSKGMLQRIGIAQAMVNDPDLLILDEPMSGLDPIGRFEIRELIRGLKERGKTVFFSSHIISDVELLADRVCILNRGEKVAEGNIEELLGGRSIRYYEVDIKGIEDVESFVKEVGPGSSSYRMRDETLIINLKLESDVDRALELVKDAGGRVSAIIPVRVNLEELFIETVGKG